MKVYELVYLDNNIERSLGMIFKDEQKAFAEKRIQNLRCGSENKIYPPYQVRERVILK